MNGLCEAQGIAAVQAAAAGRPFSEKLLAIRMRYPTLEIQPAPSHVRDVFIDANTARTVQLPDGTQLVRFSSSAQPFYVQVHGAAVIPTTGNDTQQPAPLVNPEGWYDVSELRQLSLIAPANTIVSLHCLV